MELDMYLYRQERIDDYDLMTLLQKVCKKAHDFSRGMNCQQVNVATKSNYFE